MAAGESKADAIVLCSSSDEEEEPALALALGTSPREVTVPPETVTSPLPPVPDDAQLDAPALGVGCAVSSPEMAEAVERESEEARECLLAPSRSAPPSAPPAPTIYDSILQLAHMVRQSGQSATEEAAGRAEAAARGRARGPLPGHHLTLLECIEKRVGPGDQATATAVLQDSLAASQRQGLGLAEELVQRLCDSLSVEVAWYWAHQLYKLLCTMPAAQTLPAAAGDRIADALAHAAHVLSEMLCHTLQEAVIISTNQSALISLLFAAPPLSALHAQTASLFAASLARSFILLNSVTSVLLRRHACRRDGIPSSGAFAATHLQLMRIRNAPPTALWTLPRLRQVHTQAWAEATATGERRKTMRGCLRRLLARLEVRLMNPMLGVRPVQPAAPPAPPAPPPPPPAARLEHTLQSVPEHPAPAAEAALLLHSAPESDALDLDLQPWSAEEDAAIVAALTDPLRSLSFKKLFVELGSRLRRMPGSVSHRWYGWLSLDAAGAPAHKKLRAADKKLRAASSGHEPDEPPPPPEEPPGEGEELLPGGRRWEREEDEVLRQAYAMHPHDMDAAVCEAVQYLDLGLDPERTVNAACRRLLFLHKGRGGALRRPQLQAAPQYPAQAWTKLEEEILLREVALHPGPKRAAFRAADAALHNRSHNGCRQRHAMLAANGLTSLTAGGAAPMEADEDEDDEAARGELVGCQDAGEAELAKDEDAGEAAPQAIKARMWTTQEDEILLREVAQHSDCKAAAFRAASDALHNRNYNTCAARFTRMVESGRASRPSAGGAAPLEADEDEGDEEESDEDAGDAADGEAAAPVTRRYWTPAEDAILREEIALHSVVEDAVRAANKRLPHRALNGISSRYHNTLKGRLARRASDEDADDELQDEEQEEGEPRSRKHQLCSAEDDAVIAKQVELHPSSLRAAFRAAAALLPGKSFNRIKSRWYSRLRLLGAASGATTPSAAADAGESDGAEEEESDEGAARVQAAPPAQRRSGSRYLRFFWSAEEDEILLGEVARHPGPKRAALRAAAAALHSRNYNACEKRHAKLLASGAASLTAGGAAPMEADEDEDDEEESDEDAGDTAPQATKAPMWMPAEDAIVLEEIALHSRVIDAAQAANKRLPHRPLSGICSRYYLYLKAGGSRRLRRHRLQDLEPSPPPEAAPHAMLSGAPPLTPAPSRPRWCYRAGDQVCGPWKLSAYRKWVAEGTIDAWTSEHVRVWHTEQTEEEAVPLTQALATRRAQQAAKYGWIA